MFWRRRVLFVGPLIPLIWTSDDICPGFQSHSGSLACVLFRLCAMDSSDSPLVRQLPTSITRYFHIKLLGSNIAYLVQSVKNLIMFLRGPQYYFDFRCVPFTVPRLILRSFVC